MTDESQRIAIAESLGWTEVADRLPAVHHGVTKVTGLPAGWDHEHSHSRWDYDPVPYYLSDLNACHEMEKGLLVDEDTRTTYYSHLCALANNEQWAYEATARQRCEAYLRTKGLWRDEG